MRLSLRQQAILTFEDQLEALTDELPGINVSQYRQCFEQAIDALLSTGDIRTDEEAETVAQAAVFFAREHYYLLQQNSP